MIKKFVLGLLTFLVLSVPFAPASENLFQFQAPDIDGEKLSLRQFVGQVVLVVNTASKCGLTYQYKALQELYNSYSIYGFVIIGFPSNDFLWQEPGSNEEIIEFCEENYGVTFPMMTKVKVKGLKKHPVYQYLTQKSKNNYKDLRVTWNFQKYLINRDGQIEKIISPKARPDSEEIISWITDGEEI